MHFKIAVAALPVLYGCLLQQAVAMPPPGFGSDRHPHPPNPTSHANTPQHANHADGLSTSATHHHLTATGVGSKVGASTSRSPDVIGIKPHTQTIAGPSHQVTKTISDLRTRVSASHHVTQTHSDHKINAPLGASVTGIQLASGASARASHHVTRTRSGARTSSSRGPNATGFKPEAGRSISASRDGLGTETRPARPGSTRDRAHAEDGRSPSVNGEKEGFGEHANTNGGPGRWRPVAGAEEKEDEKQTGQGQEPKGGEN